MCNSKCFSIPLPFRFEDGTVPFLNIISLKHGMDTVKKLAGQVHLKMLLILCFLNLI